MQKRQASFSLGVRGSPKESAGTGDGEERGSEPPPDRGNALLLPLSRGWGGSHLEAQFWPSQELLADSVGISSSELQVSLGESLSLKPDL